MKNPPNKSTDIIAWPTTPLGPLWAEVRGDSLTALHWGKPPAGAKVAANHPVEKIITAYFKKPAALGAVKTGARGTPFQHKVWAATRAIPVGTVLTYGDLARLLGTGPRAVARAMASNPIPLVVPCHRVVGSNGALTGYSGVGGLKTKAWLLKHEGAL
jgi:methylated-DNA-[protein]-cysteine S-methyltransferase